MLHRAGNSTNVTKELIVFDMLAANGVRRAHSQVERASPAGRPRPHAAAQEAARPGRALGTAHIYAAPCHQGRRTTRRTGILSISAY